MTRAELVAELKSFVAALEAAPDDFVPISWVLATKGPGSSVGRFTVTSLNGGVEARATGHAHVPMTAIEVMVLDFLKVISPYQSHGFAKLLGIGQVEAFNDIARKLYVLAQSGER